MKVFMFCLGLLALACIGECVLTAWTQPVITTKDGSAGVTTAIHETSAAGITGITLAATTGTGYAITSQPINGKLTFIANTGLLSLATPFDYEITGATYVIVVEGDDGTTTGTATVTLTITDSSISDPVFTNIYNYVSINSFAAAGTTVATVASSGTTPVYTFSAGNEDALFAISSAGVVTVKTGKTIDQRNTMGYILTVQSVTTNTGTAFLLVCVGTNCSSPGSSAICITGSLALILAAVLWAILNMYK